MEGRITCWIAGDFAHLRVMLDAPPHIRVSRIAERPEMTIEKAREVTNQRDNEEREWFLKNRGIDLEDISIFDLIINTERLSADQVVQIIKTVISTL